MELALYHNFAFYQECYWEIWDMDSGSGNFYLDSLGTHPT